MWGYVFHRDKTGVKSDIWSVSSIQALPPKTDAQGSTVVSPYAANTL
jgi:hypothetical protein